MNLRRGLIMGAVGVALLLVSVFAIAVVQEARKKIVVKKQRQAAANNVMRVLSMSDAAVQQDVVDSGIRVDGEDFFRRQIYRALCIIKHNCPTNYVLITNNIQAIQPGERSWVFPHMNPPVCLIETNQIMYSATWGAQSLVRYGLMAQRHRNFRQQHPGTTVPNSAWASWKQQKQCLLETLAMMPQLGATDSEIESLTKHIETWYPERQQDAPDLEDFQPRPP